MSSASILEHASITVLVVAVHALLLWMGLGGAERRLWAKFVGLMFLVLVTFANVALVISRESVRMAALIAISLLAAIVIDWRRKSPRVTRFVEGDNHEKN